MSEIWRPSAARIANSNLTRFMRCVNARRGLELGDYAGLYAWSVDEPADFWTELARFADVRAEWGAGPAIEHPERMPGAHFFPAARLNFAANLLKFGDERPALVFRSERGTRRASRYGELRAEVARIAAGLRSAGVGAGDRVAGYLPNLPETMIAMLADRQSRRHLVVVLAGLRRAGRARPLRPDRAQGAVRRRRLLVRAASRSTRSRQVADDRRAACRHRARGGRALCRRQPELSRLGAADARRRLADFVAPYAAGRSSSRACRSTTRSTSCFPPARPACPSASCTAPAARCCST